MTATLRADGARRPPTLARVRIEPDVKDWTWVIEQPCPDCGFDAAAIDVEQVPDLLRDVTAKFADFLASSADVARRRNPTTWSPLEYACHVRDCNAKFDERLQLMLAQDDPLFANWDQDAAAVDGRYAEQDPVIVAGQLRVGAEALAHRFATVAGPQWHRTGRRSNGSYFTTETLARYFIHDPIHHWWDVAGPE